MHSLTSHRGGLWAVRMPHGKVTRGRKPLNQGDNVILIYFVSSEEAYRNLDLIYSVSEQEVRRLFGGEAPQGEEDPIRRCGVIWDGSP
jgi:hypothetical protein